MITMNDKDFAQVLWRYHFSKLNTHNICPLSPFQPSCENKENYFGCVNENSGVGQASCAASLCDRPIVKRSKKLKETKSN
jgi:hypothetical protein